MKGLARGQNQNQAHCFACLGVVRPGQTLALGISDNPGLQVSFHVGHRPIFLLLKLNGIGVVRIQESTVHSDKIRAYPDNRENCCLTHKAGIYVA